jgi:hypothetical protein
MLLRYVQYNDHVFNIIGAWPYGHKGYVYDMIGFEFNDYFVTGAPYTNGVTVIALLVGWATQGRT